MRATVLVAEATPDLAAGTAPTTASVAGAMTQPIARVEPEEPGDQRERSGVRLQEHGQRQQEREARQAGRDDA